MGDSQPAAQWKPKATLKPEGSRLLLLISSMSGSLEVKTRQSRVRGILDASFLPREQVEILDGSDPAVKQRRLQLFILSGKRAQYPQLFLVTPSSEAQDKESETTKYLGNAEGRSRHGNGNIFRSAFVNFCCACHSRHFLPS